MTFGCAQSSEPAEQAPAWDPEDLLQVTFRMEGGLCAECWREISVQGEKLVIADASRAEEFELSDDEVKSLRLLTNSPAFGESLVSFPSWSCSIEADSEEELIFELRTGITQIKLRDGCSGYCNDAGSPLVQLVSELRRLKQTYLSCSANHFGYCRVFPEAPGGGMSCVNCLDDCGRTDSAAP